MADWSRVLISGGLKQGRVQWLTGTGSLSLADRSRVLIIGGLEQGLVPSRIYCIVNLSCSAAVNIVTQHGYLPSHCSLTALP